MQDLGVKLAKQEIQQANALYNENSAILNLLIETNREESNKEAIKERQIKKAELEFNILKGNVNLQKEEAKLQDKQSKQAQQAGAGLLGASTAGQQALGTARKQRSRQLKSEDFKTQEQVFTKMRDEENKIRSKQGLPPVTRQDMMNRVAQQQAAGEMPSLANKLTAGATGANPEQLAREGAGGKDSTEALIQAVQSLVGVMKSGTYVK
jgi:uncharacterized protein YkwD